MEVSFLFSLHKWGGFIAHIAPDPGMMIEEACKWIYSRGDEPGMMIEEAWYTSMGQGPSI